jgi:hypothetical protein
MYALGRERARHHGRSRSRYVANFWVSGKGLRVMQDRSLAQHTALSGYTLLRRSIFDVLWTSHAWLTVFANWCLQHDDENLLLVESV